MKELLMKSLNFCNAKYQASLVAYALMPEHLHLMIYFRDENHLSEYMREFKKFTSVQIRKHWENENPDMIKKIVVNTPIQTYKVWMDRFDDLHLYSTKVCYTKLRYINNNPVERGLCERPQDYQYSSAAFYAGKVDNKTELVHLHDLL